MTELGTDLEWLASTLASDATGGRGVLAEWVRPIREGSRAVGYAATATVAEDDNLAVRQAVAQGTATGTVLVVGGAATSRTACMGDLVAQALVVGGFRAVVTDGLVRDVAGLRAMPLAVWCRGVTPRASRKDGPSQTGLPVACAGVVVAPGDLVVADDDGVVIWPRAQVEALLGRAREKQALDESRTRAIAAGGPLD